MSDSRDTLLALLSFALAFHGVAVLAVAVASAYRPNTQGDEYNQDRKIIALLRGRTATQRTGQSQTLSRLLTVSALLLASASAISLSQGGAPAWTTTLAVLTLLQLASAYAWCHPRTRTGAGDEQATPDDIAEHGDPLDPNHEEVTRKSESD